jgi:maltooligosyltrehalose trehalohydrolase
MRSKLNWAEASQPPHAELLEWYRGLIRLRRDKVEVPRESRADSCRAQVRFDAGAEWLTFVHNGVLAAFNLADRAQRVPIPEGEWNLALRSDSPDALRIDEMPPRTTFIYIGG